MKKNKESKFQEELRKGFEKKRDESLPEEDRKEIRYKKLESVFTQIGNNKNKYIFYCPDIPFASTIVSTIYEQAFLLQEAGYNTLVLHDEKGFKPNWLTEDYVKKVKVDYLTEKNTSATKIPEYKFNPTDTIIVPESFWSIMQNFAGNKTINKVVLAFGYGGFATDDIGIDFSMLGFHNVICLSEQIKNDYQAIWPHLTYHVCSYTINTEKFSPLEKTERQPTIGLSIKSRSDAAVILNLFRNKYPYFGFFDFRILKKLTLDQYAESLKECSLLVHMDEKDGYPKPVLEAIACDVPVLTIKSRNLSHLSSHSQVIQAYSTDWFEIVDLIAEFCVSYLEAETISNLDKEYINNNHSKEFVTSCLLKTVSILQEDRVKFFSAVKTAIDEGKLDAIVLDSFEIQTLGEFTETEVKQAVKQ